MIQANELRIGNWINCYTFEDEDGDYAYKVRGEDIANIVKHNSGNRFAGISLTEEWLLKFGFENFEFGNILEINFFKYQVKVMNGFCWFYRLDWEKDVAVKSKDEWANEWNRITKLTHVHQLQNLYFALTGEELEIKDLV